ncbi:MAG: aldo/keto reductase [Cyanobacteriota bacterium]
MASRRSDLPPEWSTGRQTQAAPEPTTPEIAVGTWAWGNQFLWGYAPDRDPELQATFKRAVDLGLTVFDTADSYGTGRLQGRSEALLGQFAAALPEERRRTITVATKLAPFPWRLGRHGFDRAFQASRQRLQGKLDRVQLHWSTARYAPWQEDPLIDGLADLLEQGQVSSLGVSNMGPQRLRRVHRRLADRGLSVASVQVQASLLAPEVLTPGGLIEVCRELGITLLAYSPLALGLLSRPATAPIAGGGPRRWLAARLQPSLTPLLESMAEIAVRHGAVGDGGADLAAVALNWCRSHGAVPIVGLRRVAQAEAAAAAREWVLEPAERDALDRLALALPVRMPANPFESA